MCKRETALGIALFTAQHHLQLLFGSPVIQSFFCRIFDVILLTECDACNCVCVCFFFFSYIYKILLDLYLNRLLYITSIFFYGMMGSFSRDPLITSGYMYLHFIFVAISLFPILFSILYLIETCSTLILIPGTAFQNFNLVCYNFIFFNISAYHLYSWY